LKENTIHLPDVKGLETDFMPVFFLCTMIAHFLEETQELSWGARRILSKDELSLKAKAFTTRVDEVSCQVLLQLNIRANQANNMPNLQFNNSTNQRSPSLDSNDSTALESEDGLVASRVEVAGLSSSRTVRHVGGIIFISIFITGVLWILLQPHQ
jgi:hypothetical protein